MAQYLLLIRDNLEGYSKYNTSEIQALINKMGAWSVGLKKAGLHKGAEKLTDHPGKILSYKNGVVVSDGPYAESKEIVGGFFLIEAKDYSDAIKIAAECPALTCASTIEIREAGDCETVLERASDA
jgi:hypothetical protein